MLTKKIPISTHPPVSLSPSLGQGRARERENSEEEGREGRECGSQRVLSQEIYQATDFTTWHASACTQCEASLLHENDLTLLLFLPLLIHH